MREEIKEDKKEGRKKQGQNGNFHVRFSKL